jgi:thioredoxin-dependent peroxiredoxin
MDQLKPEDKAPSFKLSDQNGKMVSLSKFKGKKLLLYFYPRADTPGCTRQACSVRDSGSDLTQAGIESVGISPDKPDKLKKFDEKHGLGFTLLSDEDHSIANAYGAWGEKKMYGKVSEGIFRSVFLIDEKGKIVGAWYKVKPEQTVPNVMKALEARE